MFKYITKEFDALSITDPDVDAILKSGKVPKPEIDYTDCQEAVKELRELLAS